MTEENIKKSWKNLKKPLIIGLFILIASFLVYKFGARSISLFGFYGCILGLVFIVSSSYRMYQFNTYLKENNLK